MRTWPRRFFLREERGRSPDLSGEPRGGTHRNPRRGTKPKGASGNVIVATRDAATDSVVEQDLEVGSWAWKTPIERQRETGGIRVRENGGKVSGRSDAVRLLPRGKLRRVRRHWGRSRPTAHLGHAGPRPETWRTPWLAVECNKSTGCRCGVNRRSRVERQGRNAHGGWQLRAEGQLVSCRPTDWERTRDTRVSGGAIFENR